MPIRAELRVTARGLKLLGKLSAGPTRARAVAQTAINSTLKRDVPREELPPLAERMLATSASSGIAPPSRPRRFMACDCITAG